MTMSDKHRFKGLMCYEAILEIVSYLYESYQVKPLPVIEQLFKKLVNALAPLKEAYQALVIGKNILDQLTDLLYGKLNKNKKRPTQQYKEQTNSQQVKQQVEQLLEEAFSQHKTHSHHIRGYLRHFENTYHNWKTFLFTCYDYPFLPNDNNEHELTNSQLKKQYRRITGQSSTAKYLKNHGEQAGFILNYAKEHKNETYLIQFIQKVDQNKLKELKRKQKDKSRKRAKTITTKKQLTKTLKSINDIWLN